MEVRAGGVEVERAVEQACAPEGTSFLESSLPFRELSLIAAADKANADPAYAIHRWWARRPPGVMRGLLLAAALPASTTLEEYWRRFGSVESSLSGLRVHDPFVGGGSTMVEAARLGAIPSGTDVDPLAVAIVSHELDPPDRTALMRAAGTLSLHVEKVAARYFEGGKTWTPLHWFSLQLVKCPECKERSALYKNLVIARDVGKTGGVVRDCNVVAFCPDCFDVKHLDGLNRNWFDCCGGRHQLSSGTFTAFKFTCPACDARTPHAELKTAAAPRKLIAIEETSRTSYRRIRKPRAADDRLIVQAATYERRHRAELAIPTSALSKTRHDDRPVSYGIEYPAEFFTERQRIVFGAAFRWIAESGEGAPIKRALRLAVSNALTNNNRLCGYATDYGRLAPLFSVRSYSLPALSVELNPFHQTAGRGTLVKVLQRLGDDPTSVRRHTWSTKRRRALPVETKYVVENHADAIECASAVELPPQIAPKIDICVFDPPYFDYIAYSELSEFYRVWLANAELGGVPLMPTKEAPVASFAKTLSESLHSALQRLRPGAPIAFTYHAASEDAWKAVGDALDAAHLTVTAVWPLQNDGHTGHHTTAGNCEWDVVVVARASSACERAPLRSTLSSWLWDMKPLTTKRVDKRNLRFALAMAGARFGRLRRDDKLKSRDRTRDSIRRP